jgi:hypothetical protein
MLKLLDAGKSGGPGVPLSRYSQLYIERGNRLLDSERFRVRLQAIFENNLEGVWR